MVIHISYLLSLAKNCPTFAYSCCCWQDELDGGYNKKQSWSGLITQHNLWDFSIEDFDIENFAECRSDAFGNIVR